ncbi:MAG: type IV toxin-antitoxin system AbiEi family antitoxin domain-containing protein [Nostocoides sp.]
MEPTLQSLALSQDGVFTTIHATTCGTGRRELARLLSGGQIVSLGQGVYALREAWPTGTGPKVDVEQHRVRCRGALLRYPDAHLCGVSLLAVVGVDLWGVPLDRVDLVRPIRQQVLTQSYRIRPVEPISRPAGNGQEAIAAACVQLCLDYGVMPAICSMDNALRDQHTAYDMLEHVAAGITGRARSSRLATVLPLVDARSDSVGESRMRVSLATMGFKVLVQVEVMEGGRTVASADLGIDGTNYLIEFDGRVKYGGGDPEVLWAEKRREDRIRRRGNVVDRFIWGDLDRPAVLRARVNAGVSDSERCPSTWEENQRLRTVWPGPRGRSDGSRRSA